MNIPRRVMQGILSQQAAAPPAGWTPTDLANLLYWYDFSDTSTITEAAGLVSQVDDKSTVNRDITASGANRPTTGTRTMNLLNTLDFNSNILESSVFTQAQPITIFATAKSDLGLTTSRHIAGGGPILFTFSDRWHFNNGTSIDSGVTSGLINHQVTAIFDGVSSSLREDAVQIASGDIGTDGYAAGGNIKIGSGWRGIIGEVFAYSSIISGTDLSDAESYLSDKWIS